MFADRYHVLKPNKTLSVLHTPDLLGLNLKNKQGQNVFSGLSFNFKFMICRLIRLVNTVWKVPLFLSFLAEGIVLGISAMVVIFVSKKLEIFSFLLFLKNVN